MAVASKSGVSVSKAQPPLSARTVAGLNPGVMPLTAPQGAPHPLILLRSRSTPSWLLRLCCLQHRFSALMFLLVTASLLVYGWAVYSQQKWSQAYRELETLQIHERQLTTTNEALKYQMVRQARQPETGLIPPAPTTAIVLPSAPPPSLPSQKPGLPATKSSSQTEQLSSIPVGY